MEKKTLEKSGITLLVRKFYTSTAWVTNCNDKINFKMVTQKLNLHSEFRNNFVEEVV